MTDALAKVMVQVNSLAKPVPQTLMAARTAIRVAKDLQEVFERSKAEGWTTEALADALYVRLPEYLLEDLHGPALWDVALYLADEYVQFGDSLLLVSTETGQAVAKLSHEDIYLPDLVSRETGALVQPRPRLRPDLEGQLVDWVFTRGREGQLLETLAKRSNQTEFLRREGDLRLLRATRAGRTSIVDRLRADLSCLLPECTGKIRDFISLFHICYSADEIPKSLIPCYLSTGLATVSTPLTELKGVNLRYDPYTSIRSQIGTQWTRTLAKYAAALAYAHGPVQSASIFDDLPPGLWVTTPTVAVAMALHGRSVLPVGETATVRFEQQTPPAHYLLLMPDQFKCQARELLERWEVGASFQFSLYLNFDLIHAYDLKDVPTSGISVEVMA